VRRHQAYGLHYYAGRKLPDCEVDLQPYRIHKGDVVFDIGH
jgi:hypothetical protein